MAQCAAIVEVNGVQVLSPVASLPCTSLVLLTPAEYGAMSQNPFVLSPQDGALIASAVIGVWATAYAARVVISMLQSYDGNSATD